MPPPSARCTAATSGLLLLPADLGQVEGGDREVLPDAGDALLGHHEPGVHVEPHRGRLVGEHVLHLRVDLPALLVVDGDLRLLEEPAELGVVIAEVVVGVGEVPDVPGLGVPDDGHVVVGVLPHLRQPLAPLDLLDLGADAHLGELAREHLGRAHRVVVLRRHLEDGVEAIGIAGLGQELLGLGGIVGHALRDVDEVRVERIHVGAEDLPVAEHRALQHLVLVDGVGDGQAHPLVRVGLLRIVERQRHVIGGVAQDHLEPRVLLQLVHALRAETEARDVDVARLERGQRGVGIGDEAVGDPVELGQALHPVVLVLHEHDAVTAHPVGHREGPGAHRLAS